MNKSFLRKISDFRRANHSSHITILKNTLWLGIAEGISKLAKLGMFIYIARNLGVIKYGQLNFALFYTLSFAVLTDFGINTIFVKRCSQDSTLKKDLALLFWFKLFISVIVWILIFGLSFFVIKEDLTRKVSWILGGYVALEGILGLLFSFFQAQEKMQFQAVIQIAEAIIISCGSIIVASITSSIVGVALMYFGGRLVLLLYLFWLLHKYQISKFYSRAFRHFLSKSLYYLYSAWPIGMTVLLTTLWNNSETIILGTKTGNLNVALYQAPYQILKTVLIIGSFLGTAYFPALVKRHKISLEGFKQMWGRFVFVTFLGGMLFGIVWLFYGASIVSLIYGEQFINSIEDSTMIIKTFSIILLLNFFYLPYFYLFVIMDRQKMYLIYTGIGAAVNIFLAAVLIPVLGLLGAVLAKAISIAITSLFVIYSSRALLKKYG